MIVGVDIGGTFTDVVCVDRRSREIYLTKTMTNHTSIVDGVIGGIEKILKVVDVKPAAVERIVLGTTIATNVVVQRRGARMSVFTTEGFEDVLEIGRLKRRSMYDLNIDCQTPVFLSPRRLRVGVPERVDAQGRVVRPLDEELVARKVAEMRDKHGIEAVAVVYLFSFENNAHELRTREIVKRLFPDMYVSLSCEVNPVYREYERTVVTAFDAYMRPVVERGISSMEQRLRDFGIEGEIHVMQSRGGVTTTHNAASRPVNLFLSGPAGGVVGGSRLARLCGVEDAVTIDIGGTSCDVAVIAGGVPAIRTEGEIDGFPVRVPMVDINTIGAGGGSLLRVDASGVMRVGPASAGSEPGPVCYRRGGTEPTVTDASAVLGYLNPESFAGGDFALDVDAAHGALAALGARLGMSVVDTALGAHRIMNVQMAEQIRLITVKRGYDPRLFTLIAFGGAGPLHAGVLMSMLRMKECLIPATPGVLSAYGLLNADIEVEHSESFLQRADGVGADRLASAFKSLESHCREIMRRDGLALGAVRARYSADMRYAGQSYEIPIELADTRITGDTIRQMVTDYEQQYQRMYGHANRTAVEIVNLRCVTYEPVELLDRMRIHVSGKRGPSRRSDRRVQFLGGAATAAILHRDDLVPGDRVEGPAVLEQADTTILIYPQQKAAVDEQSNLRITGTSEAYVL